MKKRMLSLTLVLVMALSPLPSVAFAADGDFTVENGVLIEYTGSGGDVVIPEGVTEIGDGAFENCTGLTGVTIPDGVTAIGERAFAGCTGLTGVTLPDGLAQFGEGVFMDCTGLTEVSFPNRLNGVIPMGMFKGCTGLTSVTIPAGVSWIMTGSFEGCTGLASVYISRSMYNIGSPFSDGSGGAFSGCMSITDVYYEGSEDQWNKMVRISGDNGALASAAIHYNTPMPQRPWANTALPTNDTLKVDGEVKEVTVYKIYDANYFLIWDVAMLLNGTPAQFSQTYDVTLYADTFTSGEPYEPVGYELMGAASGSAEAVKGSINVYINGEKVNFACYEIGGLKFFRIRDLGQALGFNVGWTQGEGMYIESDKPYDPNN